MGFLAVTSFFLPLLFFFPRTVGRRQHEGWVATVVGVVEWGALKGARRERERGGEGVRSKTKQTTGHDPPFATAPVSSLCSPPECAPSPSRSTRPRSRARCWTFRGRRRRTARGGKNGWVGGWAGEGGRTQQGASLPSLSVCAGSHDQVKRHGEGETRRWSAGAARGEVNGGRVKTRSFFFFC